MDRIRVGVIGCGSVAQVMHLSYLRELDDRFQIAALCDISPGTLQAAGEHYGVAARYADFRELVAHDLDAVLVLTPGSHAPAAVAAARAGRHVLVEKPMCFTLREADEMIAAAQAAQVTLMVAYMKRYDPGYRLAQRLVRELQGLRAVEVHIWHPSEPQYLAHYRISRVADVPPPILEGLRAESEALVREAIGQVPAWLSYAYVEVLLGSIIHDINALRGLLGAPDEILSTEIWAEGNAVLATFRYGPQVRAVLTWALLDEPRNYREDLAFLATTGRVELRFPSPFLKSVPAPVVEERMEEGIYTRREHLVSFEEAFKEELRHFHHCVTTGAQPLTGGEEGRADVAQAIDMFNAFYHRDRYVVDLGKPVPGVGCSPPL